VYHHIALTRRYLQVDITVESGLSFGKATRHLEQFVREKHGRLLLGMSNVRGTAAGENIISNPAFPVSDSWTEGPLSASTSDTSLIEVGLCLEPSCNLQNEVLISTCLKVTLHIHEVGDDRGRVSGSAIDLLVPVVCYYEHKSGIGACKALSFGEVPVKSKKEESFTVTNRSATEPLEYSILLQPSESAAGVGVVEILNGQTGRLEPGGSCVVNVRFEPNTSGKFEQLLWISNVADQLDQRKMVLTALASAPRPRFVEFLNLRPDSSDDTKYLPLDLGLIQVAQRADPGIPANVKQALPDFRYTLELRNVSGRQLLGTATSNLKSQVFIFSDSDCFVPFVDSPVEPDTLTYAYIVIKPAVSLTSTTDNWDSAWLGTVNMKSFSMALTPPTLQSGAVVGSASTHELDIYAGSLTSRPTATDGGGDLSSMITNYAPMTLNAVNAVPMQSMASQKSMLKGRSLIGGIRFVFSEYQQAKEAEPSSESPRDAGPPVGTSTMATFHLPPLRLPTKVKVNEVSVTFKATVGFSLLKVYCPESPTYYYRLGTDSQQAQAQRIFLRGSFVMENLSPVFPLDYYICPRRYITFLSGGENDNPDAIVSCPATAYINVLLFCPPAGCLAPSESRTVDYVLMFEQGVSGFGTFDIEVLNASTNTAKFLYLFVQVDRGSISCSFRATPGQVGLPSPKPEAILGRQRLPRVVCDVPIWIAPISGSVPISTGRERAMSSKSVAHSIEEESLSASSSVSSLTSSVSGSLNTLSTSTSVASPHQAVSKPRTMQIVGAGRRILTYVEVFNSTGKTAAFSPMSNVPFISVELIPAGTDAQPYVDTEKLFIGGDDESVFVSSTSSENIVLHENSPYESKESIGFRDKASTERVSHDIMQKLYNMSRHSDQPHASGNTQTALTNLSEVPLSLPATAENSPPTSRGALDMAHSSVLSAQSFKKCGVPIIIQSEGSVLLQVCCQLGGKIDELVLSLLRSESKLFRANPRNASTGSTQKLKSDASYKDVICLVGFMATNYGQATAQQAPSQLGLPSLVGGPGKLSSGKGKRSPALSSLFAADEAPVRAATASTPSPIMFGQQSERGNLEGNRSRTNSANVVESCEPSPGAFSASSLLAPEPVKVLGGSEHEAGNDNKGPSLLPLLGICRLDCSLYVPAMTVVSESVVDVGIVRSGRWQRVSLFTVINASDSLLPVQVLNIPRWIVLEPNVHTNYSVQQAFPTDESSERNDLVPPRPQSGFAFDRNASIPEISDTSPGKNKRKAGKPFVVCCFPIVSDNFFHCRSP
jgi:hypothetical protein